MTKYMIALFLLILFFIPGDTQQYVSANITEVAEKVDITKEKVSEKTFKDSLNLLKLSIIKSKEKIDSSKKVIEMNEGYKHNLNTIKVNQK